MMTLVELTTFYPVVKQHGLSKWWIYKQLPKLSFGLKRGVLPSGRATSSALVPYEEMMHLIYCASKKKSIENLIYLAWTVVYGKRMTYLASRSHGNWQRHYAVQRSKGRIAIADPEDLFALRPRFLFFLDNIHVLESVMAPSHHAQLVEFMEKTEIRCKHYIQKQSKQPAVQTKLVNIDYEQFYQFMLDKVMYGVSEEAAFRHALQQAPKRSDKGSSKEFLTKNEGGIEHFSENQTRAGHSSFKMDYEKLRRSFAELLLQERVHSIGQRKGRITKDDEAAAFELAAQDMAILEYVFEGLTDAEIVERLELACTRQALSMRRARIMELAKEHFIPLIDE